MDLVELGNRIGIKEAHQQVLDGLYSGKTRIDIINQFALEAKQPLITERHMELEEEFKAVRSDSNPMYYVHGSNELVNFCSKNNLYSCIHYMIENKISIPFMRPHGDIINDIDNKNDINTNNPNVD